MPTLGHEHFCSCTQACGRSLMTCQQLLLLHACMHFRPCDPAISSRAQKGLLGLGTCSRPVPSWYTRDVLPCITPQGARTTLPPNTCPMHWCPMHTPISGTSAPISW